MCQVLSSKLKGLLLLKSLKYTVLVYGIQNLRTVKFGGALCSFIMVC